MKYQVFIDDNFHYMDPEHRSAGQQFATLEEAVGYCRSFVDGFLISNYRLGMPSYELLNQYFLFGEDPFVKGSDGGIPFSARDYATEWVRDVYGDWQFNFCGRDSPSLSWLISILLSPFVWWRIRRRLHPRAASARSGAA
jgi:hypothetical protein